MTIDNILKKFREDYLTAWENENWNKAKGLNKKIYQYLSNQLKKGIFSIHLETAKISTISYLWLLRSELATINYFKIQENKT